MRKILKNQIILFSLSLTFTFPAHAAQQAYINGNVLTMDSDNTQAEAVLVDEGKIKSVGSSSSILQELEFGSEVIDLKGKTLLPGFIDAHGHYPGSGLSATGVNLNSPPVGSVTTPAEALALIQAKIKSMPAGKWLYADGYDDTLLSEHRLLTRQELDAVTKEHPIYIAHISGHTAMANSKALEIMGFTDESPDPPGGHFGRDKNGKLNGILIETPSDKMKIKSLQAPIWERFAVIEQANKQYLSHGVTTAQSGATPDILVKVLGWLSKVGMVPLRLVVYPMTDNGLAWAKGKINYKDENTSRVKMGAVKLFTDGSIQAYSGLLTSPYYIPHADFGTSHLGNQRVPLEELKRQVLTVHKAGKQVAIHANGDAAIEMVIKAFEYAQKTHYRSDARPIIIHSQMATPDQLKRIKMLGLTPSFFNAHVFYWGDRHRTLFLGKKRAERINPLKSALNLGIPFTLHTDTPVVPMEPMMMVWSASQRKTRSGFVLGPQERISPLQALRAITIDAAWQSFQEDKLGSLEEGKLADMVVLSDNPLKVEDQRQIKVMRTVIGGKTVYTRPQLMRLK